MSIIKTYQENGNGAWLASLNNNEHLMARGISKPEAVGALVLKAKLVQVEESGSPLRQPACCPWAAKSRS